MRRVRGLIFVAAVALLFVGVAAAVSQAVIHRGVLAKARALAKSDEPKDLDEIQKLAVRYPENAEITFLLGMAHRRAAQRPQAREAFMRAEKLGFTVEDLRREHYLMQFELGQIKEAEPHLTAILEQGCTDEVAEEIYESLVKGYVADIRLHEAMVCTDFWIEWRPRSVRARLARSFVLDMASERPRLMHCYREILAIDDTCVEAHLGLGNLLIDAKQATEAKAEFERCLSLDPGNAHARLGLALAWRHLGNLAEAEKRLREALVRDLRSEEQCLAYKELGQLAIERRDYPAALHDLRRAVDLQPDDSASRYSLAMALGRTGNKRAADEELQKSRHLEGQNARLSDLMREIAQHPGNADSRCEAGEILDELGHPNQAVACLFSALRCDERHAKTHAALARFYTKAGRADLAGGHRAWAANAPGQLSGVSPHAP